MGLCMDASEVAFPCRAGYDGEVQHHRQEPSGGARETLGLAIHDQRAGGVGADGDREDGSGQAGGAAQDSV